jgi:hypothetical protein
VASRLTRWTCLTAVAVGASIVTLLPPGVSPLALWYNDLPRTPANGLDAALRTNQEVLDATKWQLQHLRAEAALARYRTGTRSPVVVHTAPDSVREDPSLTAEAAALWGTVPHHRDAPRTLLLVSTNLMPQTHQSPERGLCVGKLVPSRPWNELAGSPVRSGAGGCLLATEFGPPGRGLDEWLNAIGNFYIPGAVPRSVAPVRIVAPGNSQWFQRDDWSREYLARWSSTLVEACSGGRGVYCVEALGFGPGGLDSLERTPRAFYSTRIFGAVPAELLRDLGPDRFGEVWRSDDPLPLSYERVSGRPFADWALRYVQQRVGRLEKDNALSLAGWFGWAFWMVLLVGWFAVRMREQPAQ